MPAVGMHKGTLAEKIYMHLLNAAKFQFHVLFYQFNGYSSRTRVQQRNSRNTRLECSFLEKEVHYLPPQLTRGGEKSSRTGIFQESFRKAALFF